MTMNDELLVKHLLGEASPGESAAVAAWIAERAENERTFRDFKTIWDRSRNLARHSDVSVDAAWSRFRELAAADHPPAAAAVSLRPGRRIRIAAAVALLACSSAALWLVNRNSHALIAVHSSDTPVTDTLPDGSVVTLNKNATIRYPRRFGGAERQVSLEGEAFFEVAPDKRHPFIITANETRVRVVGTSFNVATAAARTEVIVATGVVQVSRATEAVQLRPDEAATVYQGRAGIIKRQTGDLLYNYYRTHEFVCNGTPLSRLAEILEKAYDVQISIPDQRIAGLPLNVTFRDESLPQVLEVIAETLNIRAEQRGARVSFHAK